LATKKIKSSSGADAAPIVLPRTTVASKARVSDPGFAPNKGSAIADTDRSYLNQSIQQLRNVPSVQAIRALTRFNGIFSAAVHSYIQLAMSGYKVTGYVAGSLQFDLEATQAAQSVLLSADTLYDYSKGYGDRQSVEGLLETLLKEVLQTGACSMESVLNPYLLPEKMVAVPVTSLNWIANSDGTKYPEQQSSQGGVISLNIPTFFYAATHQQSISIHPKSPMEAALQMIFVFSEFLEDISRVLRRSGHSRMIVKILQESVKQSMPLEVQTDPVKMAEFFNATRTEIEDLLKKLEPEDALVAYDTVSVEMISAKGDKADYTALLEILGSMMASSLKSMSSVLGLGTGSQNLATTEALVYLKMVRSIQVPVETVMSRAITLNTRLLTGKDSYCLFKFNPINIRPESELSAHESVLFQLALQKLSLGLYTDDEFAHLVGTGPRAPGAPKLSGTMFMQQSATQPKDMELNTDGQARNLNEGTSQGSPVSQPGGKPSK
jgi:hypothetical protein